MAPRKTVVKTRPLESDNQDPISADSPPPSSENTTIDSVSEKRKAPAKRGKRKAADDSNGEPKPKKPRVRAPKKEAGTDKETKAEQKATTASKGKASSSLGDIITRVGPVAEAWIIDQFANQILAGQAMNAHKVYEDYIARFSLQYDEFHHAHRSSFRHKASKAAAARKAAMQSSAAATQDDKEDFTPEVDGNIKPEAENEDHEDSGESMTQDEIDGMLGSLVDSVDASEEI
ncbi:hypothetical protein HDU86_000436 [Geranomyces michiganensis]|nr:hypothetical protein HDU86_000436 [Geranomyces michiganensis]